MTRRGASILFGIAFGTTMSLLTACSLLPSMNAPPAYDGPTEPMLRAEKVWVTPEDDDAGRSTVPIALLPDLVVLHNLLKPAFAVDRTGRVRWQVPNSFALRQAEHVNLTSSIGRTVSNRPDTMIAAGYTNDRCWAQYRECDSQAGVEYGVVALSVADGKPRWATVLDRPGKHPVDSKDDPTIEIAVSSDEAVMVQFSHDEKARPVEMTAIALDPRTGKKLWTRDKTEISWAQGDRVLAQVPGPSGGRTGTIPVLLDARTGAELWRGTEPGSRWSTGAVIHTFDDVGFSYGGNDCYGYGLVVPADADPLSSAGPSHETAIELATGAAFALDPAADEAVVGRAADGPFVAWHSSRKPWLMSDLLPPRELTHGELSGQPIIEAAVDGDLWVWNEDGGGSRATTEAVDRTGARRLEPVPGIPSGVNRDWLVIYESDSVRTTIYRLVSGG